MAILLLRWEKGSLDRIMHGDSNNMTMAVRSQWRLSNGQWSRSRGLGEKWDDESFGLVVEVEQFKGVSLPVVFHCLSEWHGSGGGVNGAGKGSSRREGKGSL